MFQALIGTGANIESREDYREILNACEKDIYLTKEKT